MKLCNFCGVLREGGATSVDGTCVICYGCLTEANNKLASAVKPRAEKLWGEVHEDIKYVVAHPLTVGLENIENVRRRAIKFNVPAHVARMEAVSAAYEAAIHTLSGHYPSDVWAGVLPALKEPVYVAISRAIETAKGDYRAATSRGFALYAERQGALIDAYIAALRLLGWAGKY